MAEAVKFHGGGALSQLVVSGPIEGTVNTASSNFTFSIISPKSGNTIVTPTSAFSGTWSPTTVTLNSGSPSATATFTPTQQGPVNAISATGNNGAVTASSINFAVYSVVTAASKTTLATSSQLINAGYDEWPDGILAAVDAGSGNKYFVSSNAGLTMPPPKNIRVTGTVASPIPPNSSATVTTALTGIKSPSDYHAGGHILKNPTGYTGWILIYHAEKWPGGTVGARNGNGQRFWSCICMAVSTDLGVTWTDCGEIIWPNAPFVNTDPPPWSPSGNWCIDVGIGGYVNWTADGYLYVYFGDCLAAGQGTTGTFYLPGSYQWLCVARCLLSDVSAAVSAGNAPTFHKYNNGTWTELGLGGLSTPLVVGNPANYYWGAVAFHTDINAIIFTGSIANPFTNIGTGTPNNPASIYVAQAFSPTGPISAIQFVDIETTGSPPIQPLNPSLWSNISDGNGHVSNAGLNSAWNEFTYGSLVPDTLAGRTLSFDTTGHF